mmetsp:Transcript_13274/g.38627  ORF Transcript_13274/g.38627 Transcript_13274/m.38627 type:complete len:215 (-) Transcript_13274:727-1371(-)
MPGVTAGAAGVAVGAWDGRGGRLVWNWPPKPAGATPPASPPPRMLLCMAMAARMMSGFVSMLRNCGLASAIWRISGSDCTICSKIFGSDIMDSTPGLPIMAWRKGLLPMGFEPRAPNPGKVAPPGAAGLGWGRRGAHGFGTAPEADALAGAGLGVEVDGAWEPIVASIIGSCTSWYIRRRALNPSGWFSSWLIARSWLRIISLMAEGLRIASMV